MSVLPKVRSHLPFQWLATSHLRCTRLTTLHQKPLCSNYHLLTSQNMSTQLTSDSMCTWRMKSLKYWQYNQSRSLYSLLNVPRLDLNRHDAGETLKNLSAEDAEKLEIIKQEFEVAQQMNKNVPEKMAEINWLHALNLGNQSQRFKYYKYLQEKEDAVKSKKEMKQLRAQQLTSEMTDTEDSPSAKSHLLLKLRNSIVVKEKEFTKKERDNIESHWMPIIREEDSLQSQKVDHSKKKYFVLSMFPYPSGKLHMGHARVYTLSDAIARFHRLMGHSVIHPMGWDAFGLPAENAAIERGEKPDVWTYKNIDSMRQQLHRLGCSFDWHREFATCDPSYYKWTQYFFLKMHEKGLVYQKQGEVNWDPVDMTVLADEQIDETGRSWRSGALVEKRFLKQWCIRSTAKSQSLYEGLQSLDPNLWKAIINMQQDWIGQCDGTNLQFQIKLSDGKQMDLLDIYTGTPDLVYGIAYIAISPNHWLNQPQFYKENLKNSNTVFQLSLKAVHPFTHKEIPIIVSTVTQFNKFQVLLGIPSGNQEARKLSDELGLDYQEVLIKNNDGKEQLINSYEMNGLTRAEAFEKVLTKASDLGVGGYRISGRLRDWSISRQRYWGTPIPVIHCKNCQVVPVPYDQLPVELPALETIIGRGPSPLVQKQDWVNVKCPKCGGPAKRETDTMDTFVDSSWYFLRYLDPGNTTAPFDKSIADRFMPVDLYIGGQEHAVRHLYYARFFCHFLHDIGLMSHREPFVNLLPLAMVMGQSYQVKGSGQYLTPKQVDCSGESLKEVGTGSPVIVKWEKMSKSKYNGIDPEEILDKFGVDSTRLCILSAASPLSEIKWSEEAFIGIGHWQNQIWKLIGNYISALMSPSANDCDTVLVEKWEQNLFEERNSAVREVTFHFSKTFDLKRAIFSLKIYTKSLKKVPPPVTKHSKQYQRCLADLCIMLSPLAPSFACELWSGLASVCSQESHFAYNWENSVLSQAWPVIDIHYKLPLVFMHNNGDNGTVQVPCGMFDVMTLDMAHSLVQQLPKYQQYCQGREFKSINFEVEPRYRAVLNIVTGKPVASLK